MLYEKLDFEGDEGRLVLPKGAKMNKDSFSNASA